jgi:YD repeat-containing protein
MRARLLPLALLAWALLRAQSPVTFRYFYDDAGQLSRVLDSSGNLVQYTYDLSDNITQVTRSSIAAGAWSILNVTPATALRPEPPLPSRARASVRRPRSMSLR